MARLSPAIPCRFDDLACSEVQGFEASDDFETLVRLANDQLAKAKTPENWQSFEYSGFRFKARLVSDDFFEEGESIDILPSPHGKG